MCERRLARRVDSVKVWGAGIVVLCNIRGLKRCCVFEEPKRGSRFRGFQLGFERSDNGREGDMGVIRVRTCGVLVVVNVVCGQ